MEKNLIVVFCCAAWLQLFSTNAVAQPSVYSGAFTFGAGDLSTQAKQQTVTNFVSDAQKDVSIINFFISWATGSSTNATTSFPTTGMDYIRSHGSIPLFTWEPWNTGLGTTQSFTLANITNGIYDSYITTWAVAAKNWGHPFFLRLAHEMNGNWYPWCAGVNGNTSGQYVQMWRHVHDLFTNVGATNVTWVWCVNFVSPSFTPIDQLYPGDNYVDWISVDGYNRLANPWQDFSVLAASTVTQLTNIAPGKGGLWITYSMGKVIRYNQDGKVDAFTDKDGLPSSGICWLAADRDGTLWFARGSHVGVFRNGRFNVLENFDSSEVRIAAARSGGIWICAGQQILKFEEGVETVEPGKIIPDMASSRSSYDPSVLLEDREGAVWVGTASAGLYRCDSKAIVRVEVSNPAILSLAEDREANLWVGTRGGGLNQVHRRMISMIKSSSGLPFEGVQSVCQDATGARWAVGDNGVLARSQGTNWTIQSLSHGSVQPYVTSFAADTNGSVWIGTRAGGLYHWADGQFKDLGLQASLREKSLRSLLVMSSGDLWIGANSPDVLYRLRGEKLQSFDLPPGHRFIRAMAEDAAGNFWAGASDGLLVRVTGDALVDETAKSSSLSIRCLHGAANGDLWIGYAGAGAGRLRNGQITRFSTEQGLPNDYIAQILTDNRGNVWFAGNQGIFQVRERDFDDLAEGLVARVWPAVYGRSEGLPGLQASFDYCPASVRADDRLFFSMLSGLAEVRLDYSRLNYRPPNVFTERVTDDKQIFAVYQAFTTASSTNTAAPMELSHRGDKGELRLPPGLPQV